MQFVVLGLVPMAGSCDVQLTHSGQILTTNDAWPRRSNPPSRELQVGYIPGFVSGIGRLNPFVGELTSLPSRMNHQVGCADLQVCSCWMKQNCMWTSGSCWQPGGKAKEFMIVVDIRMNLDSAVGMR